MKKRLVTTLLVGGLMIAVLPGFVSAAHQDGDRAFVVDELIHVVADASASVRAKLDALGALERLDVVSVVDMFEMQMLINHLS